MLSAYCYDKGLYVTLLVLYLVLILDRCSSGCISCSFTGRVGWKCLLWNTEVKLLRKLREREITMMEKKREIKRV